jgi:hypothetical protein
MVKKPSDPESPIKRSHFVMTAITEMKEHCTLLSQRNANENFFPVFFFGGLKFIAFSRL